MRRRPYAASVPLTLPGRAPPDFSLLDRHIPCCLHAHADDPSSLPPRLRATVAYDTFPDCTIVGLVDANLERCGWVAERFGLDARSQSVLHPRQSLPDADRPAA